MIDLDWLANQIRVLPGVISAEIHSEYDIEHLDVISAHGRVRFWCNIDEHIQELVLFREFEDTSPEEFK